MESPAPLLQRYNISRPKANYVKKRQKQFLHLSERQNYLFLIHFDIVHPRFPQKQE